MALTARGVTGGSDINVLVDPGSTGDMQLVKLAAGGTVGSEEMVGDLDHGSVRSLYVHPRPDTVIPSTPLNSANLTTASTSYSIGDTLGSGWTIPNAAKASGGTGRVIGIDLRDYADITSSIILWFAQGSITFGTDNLAPGISDTDSLKLLGAIQVAMNDLGGVRFGSVDSMSLPYVLDGTDLYVYATTQTAHTFFGAATDLRLRVHLTRD